MSTVDADARLALWRAHGATHDEARELLAYARSPLHDGTLPAQRVPLPDAACVVAWERYAREAQAEGAQAPLRRVLVQLRFKVAAGASQEPAYLAATRRGLLPQDERPGVAFAQPDGLRLFLHPTPAGRVPVVVARARTDFEALVQAVTRRNEPEVVPASMGACTIAGYNNWERVAELRREHEIRHPEDWDGSGWAEAFRALIPQKDRYQDRFMLLSSGPYSATPAAAVGLADEEWRAASVRLRLEHECTHFFMRQAFGSMRKSLLDELVADYMGLVEALGGFRLDCFWLFMGLEAYPSYREGGRLQNYCGDLTPGAVAVLRTVVRRAAQSLARLDPSRDGGRFDVLRKARVITALTRVGLEGLAAEDAVARFADALSQAGAAIEAVSAAS